ncbi:MAG TPA: TetR/AcrR family transcriptional regulator [Solirubrobacteraceae bacterium]|nr:TetR/AcrR family transcriptional regulator [Solirubrobacteraceae bacterium]
MSAGATADSRERILEAACDMLAAEGVDDVRIARIATAAGVSPALVHYHFTTREALLTEALEHSFEQLGDLRTTAADDEQWTAAERLGWMVDQSLPFPGEGERDVRLWLELWGYAARRPDLREFAAQLYERYDAWIAEVVEEGMASGEFERGDVDEITRRLVAMLDGVGPRVVVAGGRLPLEAARRLVTRGLAMELGVAEEAFYPRGT